MANQIYRKSAKPAITPLAKPLDLDAARLEFPAVLDRAFTSPGTVTVAATVPGFGKTYLTAEKLCRLPDGMKAIVFVQTQALARIEWQERIPGSIRLIAVPQMVEENLLECPHSDAIAEAQSKGMPYFKRFCAPCDQCEDCPYHANKKAAETAKIVIAQQAHIPFITRSKLMNNRIAIYDECPATHLRTRIKFTEDKIISFAGLLDGFAATGEADAKVMDAVREVISKILAIQPGQSQTMSDPGAVLYNGDAFKAKFNKFLDEHHSGWNLLPDVLDIARMQRFVRCSMIGVNKLWWAIRPNLPPISQPAIVLDATGSRELYEELFFRRNVVLWPENPSGYRPKSEVTVFVDGAYCQSSLWDTTGEEPRPSKTFNGIMEHVEKAVAFHKTDHSSVGVVTLKKLVGAVLKKFPGAKPQNVLHYGNLRGRNELKSCSLVFVIGCQPPDLLSVAETAVAIGQLDAEPKTLIGDLEQQREYAQVAGGEFETQQFAFRNKYMKLAWEVMVTAEVAQAVGRARVHEDRNIIQHVFVFSNIDTGMPATHVLTRSQHLRAMGYSPPLRADDVYTAVMELAAVGVTFGFKEIAERVGVEVRALRNYRAAVDRAVADSKILELGKPKRFEHKEVIK